MKISDDVMRVLEDAEAKPDGIALTRQLDRALYTQVNKVLVAAGFKWDRRSGLHVHPDADAGVALDSMLSVGEVVDTKKQFQFFETTGTALQTLVEAAQIERGMTVLEPSAGSGNVVAACIEKGARVSAVEIQIELYERLLGSGAETIHGVDFLGLRSVSPPYFDRVVMNPPFARQADLTHVLHALDFLKPGGRLAAIMASGVTFRQDAYTRLFHSRISMYDPVFDPLPPGSFKAAGTAVNTVLLTLIVPEDRP